MSQKLQNIDSVAGKKNNLSNGRVNSVKNTNDSKKQRTVNGTLFSLIKERKNEIQDSLDITRNNNSTLLNGELEKGSDDSVPVKHIMDSLSNKLSSKLDYSDESILRSYVEFVNKLPYLTESQEIELVNKVVNGDELAVEELVKSHLRLVVKIAFGYYRYGLPMMDLISEGNMGLMNAVRKFDPKKGNRLSTYAMWWIRAMIQNFILKSWSIVKIASTVSERNLFFNLQKIKNKLGLGKNDSLSEKDVTNIASISNTDSNSVKRINMRLLGGDRSMDIKINNDDGLSFGDTIPSKQRNPEEELLINDDRERVTSIFKAAISTLSDRERTILLLRVQKEINDGNEGYTLEEIGKKFNISSERVRQIALGAMKKLRIAMLEYGAKDISFSF